MSCGFSIRFYWVCLWTGDFPASKIHSASSTLDEKQPKKTNCRRQKKEHYLFIYQSGRNDDSKVSGGNSCSSSPPPLLTLLPFCLWARCQGGKESSVHSHERQRNGDVFLSVGLSCVCFLCCTILTFGINVKELMNMGVTERPNHAPKGGPDHRGT